MPFKQLSGPTAAVSSNSRLSMIQASLEYPELLLVCVCVCVCMGVCGVCMEGGRGGGRGGRRRGDSNGAEIARVLQLQ